MRYVMKQKLFSWGDDFTIKTADGQDAFFVDGKTFSFGDQLSFQDMSGNELAFIKQKLLSWGPTYEVYMDGELYAVVKKKASFLSSKFTVDVPGPKDFDVKGNFPRFEYSFLRDGREVAAVSKKWFSWGDTYGVEIDDGEDDVVILASTVVIDMVCHDNNND
ncbi:MAG: hypothetical protein FVQ82_13760 [Planctomycetes bacterium]|nr:hypothetical protein [Planctomycetota bacterium]